MNDTTTPTAHPGAIPMQSFDAPGLTSSSSAAPTASPDASAAADAIMRSVIADPKMPHRVRQAKIAEAMALRQGKAPTPATPTSASPSTPAIPPQATAEAQMAESWGVTMDELSAANEVLQSRAEGITAVGLAQLAHVGSEVVDGLLGLVDTLPDSEVSPLLARQRASVERLYASPEARAEATNDVKAAIAKAFPQGLPAEVMDDISLAFDHSPRVHQQIVMMARQVLRRR